MSNTSYMHNVPLFSSVQLSFSLSGCLWPRPSCTLGTQTQPAIVNQGFEVRTSIIQGVLTFRIFPLTALQSMSILKKKTCSCTVITCTCTCYVHVYLHVHVLCVQRQIVHMCNNELYMHTTYEWVERLSMS